VKRYDLLLNQCEADIRAGRPREAANRLQSLNVVKVPAEWRLPLTKISRRVGLYTLGLSLLYRRVHGDGRTAHAPPTAAELAEYGVLLLRSGALSEAESYFRRADPAQAPDAWLYQAFADFMKWDFSAAIPRLENFLKSDISDYARLVGKTNLGYALAEARQHDRACAVLDEVIQVSRNEGHHLLERNSLCYRGLTYFQEGDFARALADVSLAQKQHGDKLTNDELVTLKYRLLFEGVQNQDLKPLNQLRELAIKARDSASHREADFFSLKVKFDLERYLYLFFGTPYPAFRERLSRELGVRPEREIYVLGAKSSPRFDLSTGCVDGKPLLKPGHKCHQILDIFLRDFYQPMRINAIFSALFPGEHYSSSSSDRVHQLIRRTRKWLLTHRIPTAIREQDEFYSLVITGAFSFRIPLTRAAIEAHSILFHELQSKFAGRSNFSAREVREQLGLPKTNAFRLLSWAVKNGRLLQTQERPGHFLYHWPESFSIKVAS
jgi:tetratricopeptide (TPR) repeat protein